MLENYDTNKYFLKQTSGKKYILVVSLKNGSKLDRYTPVCSIGGLYYQTYQDLILSNGSNVTRTVKNLTWHIDVTKRSIMSTDI